MQYDTMPPTIYRAALGRKVSDTERAEILGWIAKQREQYYTSNDTAAQHRNEPVQPIPESIPTDARKVALGFTLYHDPRISGDSTILRALPRPECRRRGWPENVDRRRRRCWPD